MEVAKRASSFVTKILLSVPLMVGFLAGIIVKAARLTWAALAEGYNIGNQL